MFSERWSSAYHQSLVAIRVDGSVPNDSIPLHLSIPTLDRVICLLTQHLKRLDDIRLFSALRPDSAANTNRPIQICLRKCDVVPRRQPRVERPIECVQLILSKGPFWVFKSEHTQGETGPA